MAIRNLSGDLVKNTYSEKHRNDIIRISIANLYIAVEKYCPQKKGVAIEVASMIMSGISFTVTCIGCTGLSNFWKNVVLILFGAYFAIMAALIAIKVCKTKSYDHIVEEICLFKEEDKINH